ncbi:tyrosyl-DNA phosphodiesterase-domain-containing protein [Mycena crocata]|nr:tyrosyl-DNA phosphodiesterase-domain-containing protein [Mycena crocata]
MDYCEKQMKRAMALSIQDQYMPSANETSSSSTYTSASIETKRDLKRPRIETTDDFERRRKKLKDEIHNRDPAEKMRKMLQDKERRARNDVKQPLKYKGGALRLTRTPGRGAKNTVSLDNLIHPNELCAAFVFSFFIENDLLFPYFPFEKGVGTRPRPQVDVYVGRDLSLDGHGKVFAGFKTKRPKGRAEFIRVAEAAKKGYADEYGVNFQAFYPYMTSGCAHTKMMVLIYPDFLRLVITSANLMECDVVDGDNTWFIQDFPRLSDAAANDYESTRFEACLIQHLKDLECPARFIQLYLKKRSFDFSEAKVYLVTSKPGSFSEEQADKYGQLRLRKIVRNKILKRYSADKIPDMAFEVCVGSVGHLEIEGVVQDLLESCAGDRQESVEDEPALKMVFPTRDDVEKSNAKAAGNISSHIDWKSLAEHGAEYLQTVFHHYHSKDPGCLFHMKSILALHADDPKKTPIYMYMGSANFSTAAWGRVFPDLRIDSEANGHPLRLAKISNFECGIVVKGAHITSMLDTDNWEDIVPYQRPSEKNRYKEGERPYKVSKKELGLDEKEFLADDDEVESDGAMETDCESYDSDAEYANEQEDDRLPERALRSMMKFFKGHFDRGWTS